MCIGQERGVHSILAKSNSAYKLLPLLWCYQRHHPHQVVDSSRTMNPFHVPLRLIGMPRYNEGDRHVLA